MPGIDVENGLSPGSGGDRLAVCGLDVLRVFGSSKGVKKGFALGAEVTMDALSAKGSTVMGEL